MGDRSGRRHDRAPVARRRERDRATHGRPPGRDLVPARRARPVRSGDRRHERRRHRHVADRDPRSVALHVAVTRPRVRLYPDARRHVALRQRAAARVGRGRAVPDGGRPRCHRCRRTATPTPPRLPKGVLSLVRVPLLPVGHAFRAGSRLRVVVQPPGGNRPAWAFAALSYDHDVRLTVARSTAHPSRVVLPVVAGVDVPTRRPKCGSLRGQPCREYAPAANSNKGSR